MAAEPESPSVHSILAADFGSVYTRLTLIDQVAGQYRLVASAQTLTTAAPPLGNVSIGLTRAIDQLSALTGRTLESQGRLILGENADGSGVDQFVATASGGRPMRVILVGLTPDLSLDSGRRALGSIYADLIDTLSLADNRTQEAQVNALVSQQPDLIFIVGGTNNGARDALLPLLNTVKLAVSLQTLDKRPVVLFAGNEALHDEVKALLDEDVELLFTRNVRPSIADEHLSEAELELTVVYSTFKASGSGGFAEIRSLSPAGVLPTATSYSTITRYLGDLPSGAGTSGAANAGRGVLSVDVGSSTVTICANINKQPSLSIRPDLGLGHSAVSSLNQIGIDAIRRWLTFEASDDDITNFAWNKTLRPSTVPQTSEELELEYAFAREVLRHAVSAARQGWAGYEKGEVLPPLRPVIGAGAIFAQSAAPGTAAQLLLDALQPVGVTELKLDAYGLIPALGAVAFVQPLAVVQVLESGGLFDLGTAICPEGRMPNGDAIQVTVQYASGRIVKRTVRGGDYQLIELPSGQKAAISLKLARGLRLNGKRGTIRMSVSGGAAGIIIDARGRLLSIPSDLARRQQLLRKWYAAARGEALPEASPAAVSGVSRSRPASTVATPEPPRPARSSATPAPAAARPSGRTTSAPAKPVSDAADDIPDPTFGTATSAPKPAKPAAGRGRRGR